MTAPRISNAALGTYLGLTFASSAVFWWIIVHGAGMGGMVFWLMWCPGLSAIVTRLIFQRNVRGQGWLPGKPTWLLAGYFLPVVYATVAYGAIWLTGQGGVDLTKFTTPVVTFVVLGSLQSTLSATGEEIGWRGFLVPALAERMSLARTSVVSGLIWSVWHYPLIIFASYNAGTATWYAIVCFTAMVVAMSFMLAWLRVRSGSFWPAALFHASHNLFVQGFFDVVTVDKGRTLWLTTEFGAALAIIAAIIVLVASRFVGPASAAETAQRI